MTPVQTILIDKRNVATEIAACMQAVNQATIVGLDCETHDANRHAGLKALGKYDDEGFKKKGAKLIFDMRRTTVCGFSVYPDGCDRAWYINLNHADEENRVPWDVARMILMARKPGAHWICHNAPFELTVFRNSLGWELTDVICTLQMAVSTYGPDEYDPVKWRNAGLGEMGKWAAPLEKEGPAYEGGEFTGRLADIVSKIIAKESKAAHSYNGFCKDVAWGYGLKRIVKSWFDVDMGTFEETLGENAHMGQITGEQVAKYGAEDAYWAVRVFHQLLVTMTHHAPSALNTFFNQENPMIHTFADIWTGGMRVNLEAVRGRRVDERKVFAQTLRELKKHIQAAGSFGTEPEARLMKREDWYVKNHAKYRRALLDWAYMPDEEDDYLQCQQVRSALSNAWADERGEKQSKGLNLTHYMPMRVLMYDLLLAPLIVSKGKIQSNGEARGKTKDKLEKKLAELEGKAHVSAEQQSIATAEDGSEDLQQDDGGDDMMVIEEVDIERHRLEAGVQIMDLLTKMAGIEQRMKLYITPYLYLTDPETERMYPVVSSQLATRRMAAQYPNPMQLAKRGESTYVRGFYLPDTEDHVLVSIDWSAIELVIIGELSGEPAFVKAFGQLPHDDLHTGTAAEILKVEVPELTEADFVRLKSSDSWSKWEPSPERLELMRRITFNLKGEMMDPQKAYKYWRTELGKGANFSYAYSGFLSTVGDRMGWSMDKTAEATDRFRQRFPVMEAWRVGVINQMTRCGWVELPDGHRRYRNEATDRWVEQFLAKWPNEDPGARSVIFRMAQKIQRRAHNQGVNAIVQGTCATIAKRSILRVNQTCRDAGWGKDKARFLIPIHDELVWSVHKDIAAEFTLAARNAMITHPDLFRLMAVDASPAVGLNFEPWHPTKCPLGQVELFEPPVEVVGPSLANKRLDRAGIQLVVDHLMEKRHALAIAA